MAGMRWIGVHVRTPLRLRTPGLLAGGVGDDSVASGGGDGVAASAEWPSPSRLTLPRGCRS